MKFWYNVVDFKVIDIDFAELFDIINERLLEDNPNPSVYDVYLEFIDNVQYYINSIYRVDDFVEDDNENNTEALVIDLEHWLEEKFGENWDEV